MAKLSRIEKLIAQAESFAAGCSRNRLELRLVDALKAEQRQNELLRAELAQLQGQQ